LVTWLKAQESTLLRVVTKQLQMVNGQSRAKVAHRYVVGSALRAIRQRVVLL
jgi:hypothetical protein